MASNPMGPGKLRGWVDFIAGIPVFTKFKDAVTVLGVTSLLSTARVSIPFAKTDVGVRTGFEVTSNEAGTEAGLFVDVTGGATQAVRVVDLLTFEWPATTGGKLRLNHFGGDVESGILGNTVIGAMAATQPATGSVTARIIAIVGSTVNLLEVDASAITNGLKWAWDKFGHLTATQAAVPGQTLGTGAGTTPTNTGCAAGSNDQYGKVQWTQGTGAPAAATTIMSVAFKNAYATAPTSVVLTSASGNTNNGLLAVTNISTTGFDIINGATQATVATGTAAVCYRVN